MRIAVLGAGAMGMLFGGYLSKHNTVLLIDTDPDITAKIKSDGVLIHEPGGTVFPSRPSAALSAEGSGIMDLVIVFVKAMHSRAALDAGRCLIGPETYVMSLQNGAGHDRVLMDYARIDKVVIGTTQHNSCVVETGVVHHGGGGKTFIGLSNGTGDSLKAIEAEFNRCGFITEISDCIQKKIWEKLFVNSAASALTAVFQTRLGFLLQSNPAWALTEQLIREAVAVADGDGMEFEAESMVRSVRTLVENASEGYTSICVDIRDGRKTEVDTISGAVVAASHRNGVPAPSHEFMVQLIHAMEDKARSTNK